MASLTIRQIDDALKQKLRIQAALHGWSMEEEVRVILRNALQEQPVNQALNIAQRIHQRFAALGGVEFPHIEREATPIKGIFGMMILDTNVLSELTRLQPNDKVMRWFAQQNEQELFTTSISHAEMLLGVKMLAEGKRQSILYQAVVEIFEQDFANKVLAFDTVVVPHYVNVVLARQTIGRPISQCDAQIAAIAECYQATLVTRNTKDFEHCGLTLVNPWL